MNVIDKVVKDISSLEVTFQAEKLFESIPGPRRRQ